MNECINTYDELTRCIQYFRECGPSLDFDSVVYVEGNNIKDMTKQELDCFLLGLKG